MDNNELADLIEREGLMHAATHGLDAPAYARQIIRALHAQSEDRVVVPVEPTEDMLYVAENLDWTNEDVRGQCCNMWYAMLAAAPQPVESQQPAQSGPLPIPLTFEEVVEACARATVLWCDESCDESIRALTEQRARELLGRE